MTHLGFFHFLVGTGLRFRVAAMISGQQHFHLEQMGRNEAVEAAEASDEVYAVMWTIEPSRTSSQWGLPPGPVAWEAVCVWLPPGDRL